MRVYLFVFLAVPIVACNPGKTIDISGHVDMGTDNYIQVEQFKGCTSLISIEGANINNINSRAFQDATQLESVDFPMLTEVYDDAFDNTKNTLVVKLGSTLTYLHENAFRGATAKVEIDTTNYGLEQILQDFGNLKRLNFKLPLPTEYAFEQQYLADGWTIDFEEQEKSCDELSTDYTSRCTC
jgi:hypothetical protein